MDLSCLMQINEWTHNPQSRLCNNLLTLINSYPDIMRHIERATSDVLEWPSKSFGKTARLKRDLLNEYANLTRYYLLCGVSLNRPPDRTWRRPPGCPRNKWLNQLRNDSTRPIGDLWRRAVDRRHGGATTRRPSLATRPCWWWWWWWWYGVARSLCDGQATCMCTRPSERTELTRYGETTSCVDSIVELIKPIRPLQLGRYVVVGRGEVDRSTRCADDRVDKCERLFLNTWSMGATNGDRGGPNPPPPNRTTMRFLRSVPQRLVTVYLNITGKGRNPLRPYAVSRKSEPQRFCDIMSRTSRTPPPELFT